MRILTTLCCLLFLFPPAHAQTYDTLIVGYNIVPPFVTLDGEKPVGPSYWLWEHIAGENDLTCKYIQLPLDSLLKGLAAGTVDIGMSPLTITAERAENIDFTYPYFIAHSSILEKEHSSIRQAFEFVKSFFSLNFFRALGALAFVILVFGLLVWLFERHQNREEFGKGIRGLWSGFWWSAVTMTTVGYGDKSPRSLGGRLVALIWMFTAIIIISGFTAGIASSLTVNRMGASGNTVSDFKDKKLGTIVNSGTDEWLRNNFYTNKLTFLKMPDLLQALQKGDVDAIAYDRPILQEIINSDSLYGYTLQDFKYNPQFYAIGMNRNLPMELREKINLQLLETMEMMEWRIVISEYKLD